MQTATGSNNTFYLSQKMGWSKMLVFGAAAIKQPPLHIVIDRNITQPPLHILLKAGLFLDL
jgi:hypothetical protein